MEFAGVCPEAPCPPERKMWYVKALLSMRRRDRVCCSSENRGPLIPPERKMWYVKELLRWKEEHEETRRSLLEFVQAAWSFNRGRRWGMVEREVRGSICIVRLSEDAGVRISEIF
jgi:hypothetical protein